MKRLFLPILVFLLLTAGAGALELEVIGGLNGLTFDPDRTTAYSESDTDSEFTPSLYILGNISIRHDISEILNFSVSIERDNILQNSINAVFGAKTDYFNFKFGAFLGLTDNFDIPDAGITGNMELIIPGIFLLSISGSSTLGAQFGFTSDNYRETAGITLGTWLGNAIPSLSANMKNFSRQIDESFFINDTLCRYLFNLVYFAKSSNISGYFCAGYQTYTRLYREEASEDKLSSLFAGIGFSWQVTRKFCFKAGLEFPLQITAEEPMTAKPDFWLTTTGYAGFTYSFNK